MKYLFALVSMFFLHSCTSETAPTESQHPQLTETQQEEAPAFPVYMSFDKFEHHIRQQNDTTYVVNFWATWCKPCVAELPYFEQLIPAVNGKPIKVLLVSMDFPKQIKSKLIPFVKDHKLEQSVVALADMDYNSWIDKVNTDWDGAIPFTLIYNKEKQKVQFGELADYAELESLLAEVMD